MEIASENEENKARGHRRLSRREFLKLGALAAAAAVLPEGLERLIYRGASKGLTTPGVTDEIVSSALEISEGAANSENPGFRPIPEIIKEGVANYTHKTGDAAVFRRSLSFRDKYYYAEALEHIAEASLLPTIPRDAIQQIKNKFPLEAFHAYVSSDIRFGQFADLFTSGSGFFARIKEDHPKLFGKNGKITDYTEYFSILKKAGPIEIDNARKHVESVKKDSGNPASASVVLEYFLGRNNGDLAQSVNDTAIFLKFMARNSPETGEGTSNEFNETWMRNHIKDEYQGPSYINLTEGESIINLVGKPYHSWNLVSMLQFFPVEMIQISGVYRQAITFKDQGLGKTRSDLQTLENLREVEQLLLSYSREGEG